MKIYTRSVNKNNRLTIPVKLRKEMGLVSGSVVKMIPHKGHLSIVKVM
jgi:bifunctional DNA-binding transcriptional regulator/antitoxin component of YhaV-PrlF toxin-antitoxin module